jgi:hypothetical protein
MTRYRWVDDRTLEVDVREGERFPDGEPLTAATVKRSFDETARWTAPHPPGTHFNIDPRTRCEVAGEQTARFHLPEPDGLALGKRWRCSSASPRRSTPSTGTSRSPRTAQLRAGRVPGRRGPLVAPVDSPARSAPPRRRRRGPRWDEV